MKYVKNSNFYKSALNCIKDTYEDYKASLM